MKPASDTGTVIKFQLRFDGQLMAKRATVDDCVGIPGVVARWRAENDVLDSVGNHHGQLVNANLFSSYFTNGPTCRAVYFNGNGGGAYIDPTPELEFKDGDDFTIESWIRVDTGAAAYTGNLVLLDHRSPPTDKYLTNPDGSFVYWPDGSRRIEGELSIGYLFSLFRQGNEQNGRWILECQINSRERYFAGLVRYQHSRGTQPFADLGGSVTSAATLESCGRQRQTGRPRRRRLLCEWPPGGDF